MDFQFNRKFSLMAALTVIWMAVIFFFSAQNGNESSGTSERILLFLCGLWNYAPSPDTKELLTLLIRKGAHMTEFGILALLFLGTLRSGTGKNTWHYPASFAASSLYAVTDELHQLFVSDRAGRATDWLIDSAGAVIFLCIGWLILRTIDNKKSDSKG